MAKELCQKRTCHIKCLPTECYHGCNAYKYAKRAIEADYRKQSEGEWKKVTDTSCFHPIDCMVCSVCGLSVADDYILRNEFKFCFKCGARMNNGGKKYESEGADDE
jgi:hypothetical protein